MKRITPFIMHVTIVFIASLLFVDTLYPQNGSCFLRNHHGQVEHITCPCRCEKYRMLDNGTCHRCGHRQSRWYPQVFTQYNHHKKIAQDIEQSRNR